MKKFFLGIFLTVLLCQNVKAQEFSTIDPSLRQEMNKEQGDELIRVNIILKSQYDQTEMRSKSNAFPTKAAKRAFVIDELKRFSKETQNDLSSLLNRLEKERQISDIKSFWIVNAVNCYATPEAIEALGAHPDVLTIGYDKEEQALFGDENPMPAEPSREIAANVVKVQADQVWDLGYTGEGVVVAVLDTGVNYDHADLQGNMWEHPDYPYHGYNFVGNNNNPKDDHGHGSHCAGTVAGQGASGSQTGMAPDAKIMALKILNSEGGGTAVSVWCTAIEFAVEHGAHVLSLSVGYAYGNNYNNQSQMLRNTMVNVLEAGVVASVAAGNEREYLNWGYPVPRNVRTPGNCPPPWLHPDQTTTGGTSAVVCIGATDNSDQAAYFTSMGPVTWQSISGYDDYPYNPGMGLIRPDVCAPGVNVKSLVYYNNTGYTLNSGTSMATPGVAGVMALMLSKNPELTPAEISEILETTAVPLSTTKSNTFGSGRIDALAAVNAVEESGFNIVFEEVSIDDIQGNKNERLNPGETVYLNVSMKNKLDLPANNVEVVLTTDDELVTIVAGNANFGDFEGGEIKNLDQIFTITLSEDAEAFHEIKFKLEAQCEEGSKKSSFSIEVYDAVMEILQADLLENSGKPEEEESDVRLYLANKGNEAAYISEAKISSESPYLTINKEAQSYGYVEPGQFKYRVYNITLAEDIPSNIDKISFTTIMTDENGKTIEDQGFIYLENAPDPVVVCNPIVDFTATVNQSAVELTWKAGGENADSYFVYCDGEFLVRTTETSYTHSDGIGEGMYLFCIEVLYSDGCTSELTCTEAVSECAAPLNLEGEAISDSEILLSWNAPAGEERSYNIYRDSELIVANTTETSFIDTELDPSVIYCYTIASVCHGDLESELTDELCLSPVGIDALENGLRIYPNPAYTVFYVEGENLKDIAVYNMLGRQIEKIDRCENKISFDLSSYAPGVYLIEITTTENVKINRKIVVAR